MGWVARLQSFTPTRGTGKIVEITPKSITAIESYIRWCEYEAPQHLPIYMDRLVAHMALMNQSFARKMAFGPLDPQGKDTSLAWRTPEEGIRRISGAYYIGWRVKKRGLAHYRLWNASKEAYFIEYGISEVGWGDNRHVPKGRIRRPVRKLSLLKTLKFMATTQAYHRIWVDIFKSRHAHGGFTQIVQSPGGGHQVWQTVSAHQAGGIMRGNLRGGRSMTSGLRNRGGRIQQRVPNAGGGSYRGPTGRLP
jgi:hypothetical protein